MYRGESLNAAVRVLSDFRKGMLGKIGLEYPPVYIRKSRINKMKNGTNHGSEDDFVVGRGDFEGWWSPAIVENICEDQIWTQSSSLHSIIVWGCRRNIKRFYQKLSKREVRMTVQSTVLRVHHLESLVSSERFPSFVIVEIHGRMYLHPTDSKSISDILFVTSWRSTLQYSCCLSERWHDQFKPTLKCKAFLSRRAIMDAVEHVLKSIVAGDVGLAAFGLESLSSRSFKYPATGPCLEMRWYEAVTVREIPCHGISLLQSIMLHFMYVDHSL